MNGARDRHLCAVELGVDLEAIEANEDVDESSIGEIWSGGQRVELRIEAHLLTARRTRGPVPLLHGFGVAAETVTLTDEIPHTLWPFEPLLSLVAERLWDEFEAGQRLTRHDRIVLVPERPRTILKCPMRAAGTAPTGWGCCYEPPRPRRAITMGSSTTINPTR